jgi:S-adenosylmethionine:tRNA-ribosyltransferase-isomerase (queuine synthetase)
MKVIQVKLKKEYTEATMTTWVDQVKDIKIGKRITLRDNKDEWWIVTEIYGTQDSENLHMDWHVGGL